MLCVRLNISFNVVIIQMYYTFYNFIQDLLAV